MQVILEEESLYQHLKRVVNKAVWKDKKILETSIYFNLLFKLTVHINIWQSINERIYVKNSESFN